MARGYMGKVLFVNLSTGELKSAPLDEGLCREFIGGYGTAARIIYDRQAAGVDPLGPDNILGFMTSVLTGTAVPASSRFAVIGKSPLTDGWGDSNAGGYFGPHLKFSGYDGIFISGSSKKPVYLFIEDGKAEIKDAGPLWGRDTYVTEDMLEEEYGKDISVACIGPAGEQLSLISGVMTKKGSAAARSGLGAVMGSKKLKAVVVKGQQQVAVADIEALNRLRKEYITILKTTKMFEQPFLEIYRKYGTSVGTLPMIMVGSTPVKNWAGVASVDFPDQKGVGNEAMVANQSGNEGCWHCPVACKGILKEGAGEYKYPAGARRPEYETVASFGPLCLNNHTESIVMANDICNRYGLDTISAGAGIAFAIECYENGLLTTADTDGIELTWGNHGAIIAMTEKMGQREGLGALLADGVKVAAEKIGQGAERYAIHIGGQELGMHDPKRNRPELLDRLSTARYQMDATPGRHTQGFGPSGFLGHLMNAAGLCMQGGHWMHPDYNNYVTRVMQAVTGWDRPFDELLQAGDRIATMRHVFNLREGINPLEYKINPRIIGDPPLEAGPHANITADVKGEVLWNLGALDWEREGSKPSRKKLLALGLEDVAKKLWADSAAPGGIVPKAKG